MMTRVRKKRKPPVERFCAACECRLLTELEEFGPICKSCYQKTRRRDPLMQAAIQRRLVTLVPALCPHEEDCKFFRMPPRYFNVIVFGATLEPIKIVGPYPRRIAEQEALHIQKRLDRKRKRGGGR